ncbi:MAG: RpiB/LacA/LacB family sugar-phosphate isomerase [Bacteroidales bacterium]
MESEQKIEKENAEIGIEIKHIGIAADHGGFELKVQLIMALKEAGYEVEDFGADEHVIDDDYPDFVIPLARAVVHGEVERGVAICGSGVGACVAANKVHGVRAALITDYFSAHQGVEDDDMNIMCLGGQVTGYALSWDLVRTFLNAHFKGDERFKRRLSKVAALEKEIKPL